MAQNYKYGKSVVEKFTIKGDLDESGKIIKYIDSNKDEKTITVERCLEKFRGFPIEFTVSIKTESDLSDEIEGV